MLAAILTCGLQVVTLTSCVDLADNPIYVMLSLLDKMWACSKNVPKMMSAGEEARYEYDCTHLKIPANRRGFLFRRGRSPCSSWS